MALRSCRGLTLEGSACSSPAIRAQLHRPFFGQSRARCGPPPMKHPESALKGFPDCFALVGAVSLLSSPRYSFSIGQKAFCYSNCWGQVLQISFLQLFPCPLLETHLKPKNLNTLYSSAMFPIFIINDWNCLTYLRTDPVYAKLLYPAMTHIIWFCKW